MLHFIIELAVLNFEKHTAGLSERSQKIWTQLVPKRAETTARLTLLEEALKNLDRADECRQILEKEGLVKGFHLNPITRIERETRSMFFKMWKVLRLNIDAIEDEEFKPWP